MSDNEASNSIAKAKYLRWGLPVEPRKIFIEQECFLFSSFCLFW